MEAEVTISLLKQYEHLEQFDNNYVSVLHINAKCLFELKHHKHELVSNYPKVYSKVKKLNSLNNQPFFSSRLLINYSNLKY